MDFITTIITNAAVTTAVIGAVAWGARTWIKERLSQSIKHKYDLDLAKFKSYLVNTNAREIEQLKVRVGAEYNIITANLLRYKEKQFELYTDLWVSLCDLEVCVATLWDHATIINLHKLASQVHNARIKIKKSALLIEDRHYLELNRVLDEFEDFQFGKKDLLDLRKSDQNEHVYPQDIIDAIEHNAEIKDGLVESLDNMMACLKRQIIKTEEHNNYIINGSAD